MNSILYILLGGLIARADGWGTENKFWKPVAEFFNAITCSILFFLISSVYFSNIIFGLCAGAAFFVWRAPGFTSWEKFWVMLWRGLWPTAIGFSALSFVVASHFYFGLLSLPFAATYSLIYSGGYKYLPETILGFNRHVWIEHASGIEFAAFVLLIYNSGVSNWWPIY